MATLGTVLVLVFNSAFVLTTLLLRSMSDAQTVQSAPISPIPATSDNSMFTLTKIKDTLTKIKWDDYFGEDPSPKIINDTEKNNNNASISYLDPNGPNVQFILFIRNNTPHNLKMDMHEDFVKSRYNLSQPTKMLVHGFLSSLKEDIFVLNKNAYVETTDYNVIGVDWSKLCEFEYLTAMRGAQIGGAALGAFINYLIKEGVRHQDIHLIGHSLGAHVVAMGADKVKGGKVGRITGLDPAGPGYTSDVAPIYRLDPSDATLVDVIHTNMRVLSLPYPQGHVDFYPNGGRFQPGCPYMYDIWTLGDSVECNHARAYHYFAETIRNKHAFKAYRCVSVESANLAQCPVESDVYMGQEETYMYGLYYVKTKATSPFSYT